MRGGFFASPNKITRAVDDLFLIAAGVQIYLTSAANRHVPGEECIAIDEKRGDLLPSGGRKTDYGQRRLLRVRGEWPRDCRAKCSEKVPPPHARPHAQVAASYQLKRVL